MKVIRRTGITPVTGERPLLRFSTGKVVDPGNCPQGISAHGHWLLDGVREPDAGGPVNTVCRCSVADTEATDA
jgi:hypothetical protein